MKKSFILLFIIFFTFPSLQWAKTVIVVSRNLPPYEQALQGIVSLLKNNYEKIEMAGDLEKGKDLIQAITPADTEMLIPIGSEANMAVKKYSSQIPVVYTMVLEEMDYSGRVATGVVMQVKMEQQLKIISKLFPANKEIGVIYNLHYSGNVINEARVLAKKLNLNLIPIAVEGETDISSALTKITKDKIGILWSVVDPTVAKAESIQLMIQHALKEKIPFIGLSQFHVKAGALAAISVSYQDIGKQTAELANRVMASKSEKPIEFPRHLVLFLNAETQAKIGLGELPAVPEIEIIKE